MARKAANKGNLENVAAGATEEVVKTDSVVLEKGTEEVKKETSSNSKKVEKTFEEIEGAEYVLSSKKYAGKALFGTTGIVINFDSEGKATVNLQEALHFKKNPNFEIKLK